jgi:hypothetical protein
MYILKLLLNVTTEIETLVSENKFLYACVKEVCLLWPQPCFDSFYQFLNIAEVLWYQPILQLGKQVAVAESEIRAVRRVVKQLPVEMLQQCLSASSCLWMGTVMEEHIFTCQHSTPFILNDSMQFFTVLQYTYNITVVPHCMNSTISTPLLSQKRVAIRADICLNIFRLFGECVCIHCFDSLQFQHSQMKPRFHHLLLLWCDWEIHCHLCGITL